MGRDETMWEQYERGISDPRAPRMPFIIKHGPMLFVAVVVVVWVATFAVGIAQAAVFEVEVHAKRNGYARLHAEGLWIEKDPALGRYEVDSSRGKPTVRRVRVHKGSNTIRVKALRWEDMDVYEYVQRWPIGSFDTPAGWPVVPASVNGVFVWGRVAGEPFERTLGP